MSYSFKVTEATQYVRYDYALVLQEPGHSDREDPFFYVEIRDNNEVNPAVFKFQELLNEIVRHSPLTEPSCDPTVSKKIKELIDLVIPQSAEYYNCGFTYEPEVINGSETVLITLKHNGETINCPLALTFTNPDPEFGYDLKYLLPSFTNIRSEWIGSDEYYFYVDGKLAMPDGTIIDVELQGFTCFPMGECFYSSSSNLHEIILCEETKPINNEEEECAQVLTERAIQNAQIIYQTYMDSVVTAEMNHYSSTCLANTANEHFTATYTDNMRHYTLYYYDQAGNLVRTVPPAGVELVPETLNDAINTDRANGRQTIFTNHRMETRYLYNSLNQLVAQYMPDHEAFEDLANNSITNGLPAGMEVTSTVFTDEQSGVLFGVDPTNPDRSIIYTTNDGGENWKPVTNFGINHLNDICMLTGRLLAGGDKGTLLKSDDSGSTWTVINAGTEENIVGIYMKNAFTHYLFTHTGQVLRSQDDNQSWQSIHTSLSNIHILEKVCFNGGAGFAVGYDAEMNGVIYTTTDAENWELQQNISMPEFVSLQLLDAQTGIALASNGFMAVTTDGGATWRKDSKRGHIATSANIKKAHFIDGNKGIALTDNDQLLVTTNGGDTWERDSRIGTEEIKDFYVRGKEAFVLTADKVYSSESLSSWSTLVDGMDYTPLAIAATSPKETYTLDSNGTIRYRLKKTLFSGDKTVDYATNLPPLTSAGVKALWVIDGMAVIVTGSGCYYNTTSLKTGTNSFSYKPFPAGFNLVDMIHNGNYYLLSSDGQVLITSMGIGWQSYQSAPAGSYKTLAVSSGKVLLTNETGINTLNNGTLQASRFTLPALHAVHSQGNNTLATGDNGVVLWNNTSTDEWHLQAANISESLQAVHISGNNTATVGSISGSIYTKALSNNRAWSGINVINKPVNALTTSADGNTLLIGTGTGEIYKVENGVYTNTPTFKSNNGVNALLAHNNEAWAVGDEGNMYTSSNLQNAPFRKVQGSNVQTSKIRTSCTVGGVTFGITNNGTLWKSADKGISWQSTQIPGCSGVSDFTFYDAQTGIAVTRGIAYITKDGGQSWQNISLPGGTRVNAVCFSGKDEAWVAADAGDIVHITGIVSQSKATATMVNSNVGSIDLYDVHFYGNTGYICGFYGRLLKYTDGKWTALTTPANGTDWCAYLFPDASYNNFTHIYAYDEKTVYVTGYDGIMIKSIDGGLSWQRKETGTTENLRNIHLYGEDKIVLSGNNTTVIQLTDKSDQFSIRFYYDKLGRLAASQNSKQHHMNPPRYSYTRYDKLGRVMESGELESDNEPTLFIDSKEYADDFPDNWSEKRYQVTRTIYDMPLSATVRELFTEGQQNLRNRVASVIYQDEYTPSRLTYNHATHYSYDIHGNVKELIQDNPELEPLIEQRYKTIQYDYDLISGNVNQVSYQANKIDQFYHRYQYDADNRIEKVLTSTNGLLWDEDATYQYYKHGPLARTELGDLKVQGIDYAYTLQGWLKGVNSNSLTPNADMGGDGLTGAKCTADAFGYSLHYYNSDYSAISGNNNFLSKISSGSFNTDPSGKDLYSGNISKMITAINHDSLPTMGKIYRYDELNRLKSSFTYIDKNSTLQETPQYNTAYSYDANGNILTLERSGGNRIMDELTYRYARDAKGNKLNNRLLHVNDSADRNAYTTDIDDQGNYQQNNPSEHNYSYDKIGNLVADKQEEIAEIVWNVQGKVERIRRTEGSDKPDLEFRYDAMGNRVSKTELLKTPVNGTTSRTTYYVRDAQGNVMAVYEKEQKLQESVPVDRFSLKEQHLYGSSRLGMRQTDLALAVTGEDITMPQQGRTLGEKHFELTNHLGNVLAVVTDNKFRQDNGIYKAHVISGTDYYPFGMIMPGRSSSSDSYRYGFGGHEKDDEVKGSGNSFHTFYREYDSRIVRWISLDPAMIKYPNQSPYVAFNNNPLFFTDPLGDDPPENFVKHSGRGGDLYLPQNANLITSSSISSDGVETTNIDRFTIGTASFRSKYDETGNFVGYYNRTNKYENPDVSISKGGILGNVLDVTFEVKNVYADGLQAIQTVQTTANNNGQFYGNYTFSETVGDVTTKYGGFVDGGKNSPYVTIQGNPPIDLMKPYYYDSSSLTKDVNWDVTTKGGTIRMHDKPTAQHMLTVVKFETIIVATNYMQSGKDVILATFKWGWTGKGRGPIHNGFNITIKGVTPSETHREIIKSDYPSYLFFGE